ncbi:TetR/AcrR family transcriptional regulator [Algicella marina]|uniref:TetR family transcriptional regulator n=1 Tax=Algicella marina TaxID=2683284 RepID=A0A6P1SVK5_9RHOB|nr:TetR/AcrR family transcriptional regulator [Algicella marina]QHQ33690.1 TetR family transcriptional regulator [Algicella marina]
MCVPNFKQRQILEAAITEFTARGFEGASMDRISALANVSKRTVYNYFDSKEALFRTISEQICDEVRQTIDVTYDAFQPLRPQLMELGLAEVRLCRSEWFMRVARMGISELLRNPELARRLGFSEPHKDIFGSFFRAAVEAGAIDSPVPDALADHFLAGIKAQAFWPAILSGEMVPEAAMEEIVASAVDTVMRKFENDDLAVRTT